MHTNRGTEPSNSVITPQHGVVTLFDYGIHARVDRGHLLIEDGIGAARRHARFPRVGHGLRRLVMIGSEGNISLAAIRWLADQDTALVILERTGKVLAVTVFAPPTRSFVVPRLSRIHLALLCALLVS